MLLSYEEYKPERVTKCIPCNEIKYGNALDTFSFNEAWCLIFYHVNTLRINDSYTKCPEDTTKSIVSAGAFGDLTDQEVLYRPFQYTVEESLPWKLIRYFVLLRVILVAFSIVV